MFDLTDLLSHIDSGGALVRVSDIIRTEAPLGSCYFFDSFSLLEESLRRSTSDCTQSEVKERNSVMICNKAPSRLMKTYPLQKP